MFKFFVGALSVGRAATRLLPSNAIITEMLAADPEAFVRHDCGYSSCDLERQNSGR
jgi:hypothetical protein